MNDLTIDERKEQLLFEEGQKYLKRMKLSLSNDMLRRITRAIAETDETYVMMKKYLEYEIRKTIDVRDGFITYNMRSLNELGSFQENCLGIHSSVG